MGRSQGWCFVLLHPLVVCEGSGLESGNFLSTNFHLALAGSHPVLSFFNYQCFLFV